MSWTFGRSTWLGPAADARSPKVLTLLVAFGVLAAWTALTNIPFYALDGADDAFYVETAHLWTKGVPPYVGAFDVKAPGFFAVLATVQVFLGASLATLRATAILSTALAAASLYRLCREFNDRAVAVLCAIVYPVLFEIFGDAAYALLCALTLLAFLAALSRQPPMRKAVLAGLAIGAACAVKQTAAFEATALLIIIASDPAVKGRRLKAASAFLACASVAPLGFVIYYALRGDLGVFFSDVVVLALRRPDSTTEAISFWDGFRRSLVLLLPILPVTLMAIFALAKWRRLAARFPIGSVSIWLAATILSILVQHAISPYYLTPAFAPLLLLAAAGLTTAVEGRSRRTLAVVLAIFGATTIFMAARLRGEALVNRLKPKDDLAILEATSTIEATHPKPTDRLFVVTRGGWIYLATDLAPPTPYFHWFHTLCDFPGAGRSRLAETMAAQPRYVVVADPSKRFSCEQDSNWVVVNDTLRSSYRLLDRAQGAFDSYFVYERN